MTKALCSNLSEVRPVDLVKVGVASAIAGLVATATATVTTLAAGPIIVAIIVGIATGYTLEQLDSKFGVTDKLVSGYARLLG